MKLAVMESLILHMCGTALPLAGFAYPVLELIIGNVFLHFVHFSFTGKNDHHGSIAMVGQLDKGYVLGYIYIVLFILCFHHVHSDLRVLIHIEVGFAGGVR